METENIEFICVMQWTKHDDDQMTSSVDTKDILVVNSAFGCLGVEV